MEVNPPLGRTAFAPEGPTLGVSHASRGRSGCLGTAIIGSSSSAGTAIAIGVAPPGSSSSLAFGGWAMDHFLKPFAPLAFRKIVIMPIHLGELVWKRIWEWFLIILNVKPVLLETIF
jgi:hypothetical protein